MRTTAVIAAAVLACSAAQADVIYDFVPDVGMNPAIEFVISDAAVARGSFAATLSFPNVLGGANPADFRSLSVTNTIGGQRPRDSFVFGQAWQPFGSFNLFNLAFAFGGGGDVTSTALRTEGVSEDVTLSGTGATAAGDYATDIGPCRSGCSISGHWTHVAIAEPPAPALLLVALAALAFWRRRSPWRQERR